MCAKGACSAAQQQLLADAAATTSSATQDVAAKNKALADSVADLKNTDKTDPGYAAKVNAAETAKKNLQASIKTLGNAITSQEGMTIVVAKSSNSKPKEGGSDDNNTIVIAIVIVVIVLVIAVGIVIVVLKGKDKGGGERAVVSFENPMYDQAKAAPQQNPNMATTGYNDVPAGGLYSEPQENFGGFQDNAQGGSGYMDVAGAPPAGGNGYMDVAGAPAGGNAYMDVAPTGNAGYMDVGAGDDDYDDDGEEDV